jgi:hypothetical protein
VEKNLIKTSGLHVLELFDHKLFDVNFTRRLIMEQPFAFGFSGDDVDEVEDVNSKVQDGCRAAEFSPTANVNSTTLENPRSLDIGEMVGKGFRAAFVPYFLSYSCTLSIEDLIISSNDTGFVANNAF